MIIWLASYPKSGNTWLRSIISSLVYTEDGLFSFKLLNKIPQFPSQKYFKEFTNDFTNIHEIKKLWIAAQNKINLDKKIKFFKTHQINCKIDGFNFTNKLNTLATIYIVRDPRNLINSISNHYDKSIEDAKEFLLTPKTQGSSKSNHNLKTGQVVTLIGNWSENYKFWKQNNENFLLIKYENLLENIDNELEKIVVFLKKYIDFDVNDKKLKNIINTTNFRNLKKMEEEGSFNENAYTESLNKKINFFYQGPENNWKSKLESKIVDEINLKFKREMIELGYL
mgnify:FL=1